MSLPLLVLAAASLASAISESAPVVLTKSGEYIEGYEAVMAFNKVPGTVLAIWEKNLASGKVSTSLYDSDFTVLTKYACGNTIESPELGIDATFDLDDTAKGHVSIAGVQYPVATDPEETGGISCSRVYNGGLAVAECYLPVSSVLTARDLPALANNGTTACFGGDVASEDLFGTVYEQIEGDEPFSELFSEEAETIEKRQLPPGYYYLHPRRDGNGSPHRWRRHLTTTQLVCSSRSSCSAIHSQGKSVTHGASFGASLPWINGGYSVSVSWSTENSYQCDGGKNDVTCVKHRRYYQEYRLIADVYLIGNTRVGTEKYQVRSPVRQDGRGPSPRQLDGYYCVVNSCRGENYVHWENQGPGVHNAAK